MNIVDGKIREYGFFVSEHLWIGGIEGAGIVEQVCSEVANVAVGDKMYVSDLSRTVSSQGGILTAVSLYPVSPVSQGWFTGDRATFQ